MRALFYACVVVVPTLASPIHIRVMQRRHDAEQRLAGMRAAARFRAKHRRARMERCR